MIESIISWARSQETKKTKCPVVARHVEKLSALSPHEQQFLLNYNYAPKKSKATGQDLPESLCSKWGAQYLMIDRKVVAPQGFEFLIKKLQQLSIYNHLSRILVLSLDTNGYINPHSDHPMVLQVAIPLVFDDGFHYVWEDWGEEVMPQYSVNLINIQQTHSVWNTGSKRIFINCTTELNGSGLDLIPLFANENKICN